MQIRGRIVNIGRSRPNKIHLTIRTENKEKIRKTVYDFKPYFYVEGEGEEYTSVDNKKLKKVIADDYSAVPNLREQYNEHYEADIPYVRRFLVDNNLTDGIEFVSKERLKCKDIRPADMSVDIRIVHLDIEVALKPGNALDAETTPNEIVAVSLYDSYSKKYATLVVGEGSDKNYHYCRNEKQLLKKLRKFFQKVDPDLIVGWNVRDYDVEYLNGRFSKNNLDKINIQTLDLREADKRLFRRPHYNLSSVAVEEEVADKDGVKTAILVLKEYEKGRVDTLARYNENDVKYTVELDKLNNYTGTYISRKKLIGLENYDKIFTRAVPIETMLMRMLKREHRVLPRIPDDKTIAKRNRNKKELKNKMGIVGGRIIHPPYGVFKDVAFYDMKRYYPTILSTFNISPEIGSKKTRERGIIPRLCDSLGKQRDKVDKLLKAEKPGSKAHQKLTFRKENLKTLVNAVTGYMGYVGAKLYSLDAFYKMTSLAREGLKFLEERGEERSYKMLYADTDGIFCQVPLNEAEELCESLEQDIISYFEDKYDVDASTMELDFERFYDAILWKRKTKKLGAKKRYAGHVTYEGGEKCDYFYIKGFDCIRLDSSDFVRDKQRELIQKILTESREDVRDYVLNLMEKFGEMAPEYIAPSIGIGKPLNGYKTTPYHVRGALYANMYLNANFTQGDRPKVLYVKSVEGAPDTDVVAFDDETPNCEVDWDKMRDKQIKSKFKDLLELVGINYDKLEMKSEGQQFLEGW